MEKLSLFQTRASLTGDMRLEEVVDRLSRHPDVDGVLIIGSQSQEQLTVHSDYDLLLVLDPVPLGLHVAYTVIDGRVADIIFTSVEQLNAIGATSAPVPTDGAEGSLIRWLQHGRIAVDRHEHLQRAQFAARERTDLAPATPYTRYATWFGINFNLRHNKRMLASPDPVYQMAVDLRLLYGVFDVLLGYFRLRGLPWQGEKAAIRYLAAHDDAFLQTLQSCLAEGDREQKVALYEQLARHTLEPAGGVWPVDSTALQFDSDDFVPEIVEQGLNYWERLVGGD